MIATLGAEVVNDYLILQYAKLIFGFCRPPLSRRPGSFAQHATTMFFPHFVGDARTIRDLRRRRPHGP